MSGQSGAEFFSPLPPPQPFWRLKKELTWNRLSFCWEIPCTQEGENWLQTDEHWNATCNKLPNILPGWIPDWRSWVQHVHFHQRHVVLWGWRRPWHQHMLSLQSSWPILAWNLRDSSFSWVQSVQSLQCSNPQWLLLQGPHRHRPHSPRWRHWRCARLRWTDSRRVLKKIEVGKFPGNLMIDW